MRTRSSRSTEDLVELDFTTGRKRVQRSQRVQEEPEVLVADTMDVPEGNGNPLGNGLGRARQTRPIGLGDAPNRHQQRQGIFVKSQAYQTHQGGQWGLHLAIHGTSCSGQG
ncbi:unnamed protein product [Microthlaspi erraticum]|uniref:Uncharacterized protein n=1 Tax=Microthlaspi erraticum TaxID=1685480 RepID=A0A6D2HZK7_9BRAS|nr:unnamed protein product [Microthlaspi erraticum]